MDTGFLIEILSAVGLLLAGGTITIGSMKIDLPVGKIFKNLVVSDKDIIENLSRIESYHAVTIVFTVKRKKEITKVKLTGHSIEANSFYGLAADSKRLLEMDGDDFWNQLEQYMDRKDFLAMKKDQTRVYEDYAADRNAYAKVPIKFNKTHPEYPNKSFLPIIVGLTPPKQTSDEDEREQRMTIMYLDMSIIPNA